MLRAGILEEFWKSSLNDFKGTKKIKDLVEEYTSNLKNARKEGISLFLYGNNGTGKSLISICILKEAIKQGFTGQFTSLTGIIKAFSDGWSEQHSRELYESRIRDVDFLVIDDCGKEYRGASGMTEVVFEHLMRYRSMRNKPIIATSNLASLEEIGDTYSRSLVSIMRGKFLPVHIVGEDFRSKTTSESLLKKLKGLG